MYEAVVRLHLPQVLEGECLLYELLEWIASMDMKTVASKAMESCLFPCHGCIQPHLPCSFLPYLMLVIS